MSVKITTESGAKYELRDGRLTRVSDTPILNHEGPDYHLVAEPVRVIRCEIGVGAKFLVKATGQVLDTSRVKTKIVSQSRYDVAGQVMTVRS